MNAWEIRARVLFVGGCKHFPKGADSRHDATGCGFSPCGEVVPFSTLCTNFTMDLSYSSDLCLTFIIILDTVKENC